MRGSVFVVAIALMAAGPVWAQPAPPLVNRTVLPAHVMCADVLVPAMPVPVLRLKGGHHHDQRLTLARGDLAVVSRLPDDGLAVGQRYLVRRLPQGERADLPRAGGHVPIRTAGWLTIVAVDEVNAMARIDYACDAITADDYLDTYAEPVLPAGGGALGAPDFTERVAILTGVDGRLMFGDGDTFSIARGREHGVTTGARYAIYRDRKDGKPLVHLGEAIVTEPSAGTAKLLLLKTADAVESTDIAVPRRR